MKYQEAQEKSVSGVAVLGNEAMQEIIWPKDSPHPFGCQHGDGYVPLDPVKFVEREGWKPLHWARGERPPVQPYRYPPPPRDLPRWWEFWKTSQ